MKRRSLLLVALLLPLSACSLSLGGGDYGYYGHPHHVPPPYGDWRWDDDLDVYVSIGYPRLYFRDRVYYRWDDHGWYRGEDYRGPWKPQGHKGIPPGLSREHPHSGDRGGQGGYGSGHDQDKWGGQPRHQGQQGQGQYRSQPGGGSKSGSPSYDHGKPAQGQSQSQSKGQGQGQKSQSQSQSQSQGQSKSSNKGGQPQKKRHEPQY